MPARLVRRVTANWGLKVAALALALLLWVVVSAEQVTTQWVPVRVQVVLHDPRLQLTGGAAPAVVDVRFSGSGRDLWELAFRHPVLTLAVREPSETGIYALEPAMVSVPGRIAVAATDIRPEFVRLSLARLSVRELPVRVRWAGAPGERVEVTPSHVVVLGAREALAAVDSVATVPVAPAPGDTLVDREVPIDPGSVGGMRSALATVRVRARFPRATVREVPAVTVDAPAGAVVSPLAVVARLEGPAAALEKVNTSALRARLHADSVPRVLPSPGADLPIEVTGLPVGVSAVLLPSHVRVMPGPQAVTAVHPQADTPAVGARP